jgi:hypothetical protein
MAPWGGTYAAPIHIRIIEMSSRKVWGTYVLTLGMLYKRAKPAARPLIFVAEGEGGHQALAQAWEADLRVHLG